MNISNKLYDILKWIGITVMPALLTLYGVIGTTCNLEYTEQVITIGTAVIACYNTILGVQSMSYNKSLKNSK